MGNHRDIAIGSAAESDSLLAHAALVEAIEASVVQLNDELTVIRKMLFRLRDALQSRPVVEAQAWMP